MSSRVAWTDACHACERPLDAGSRVVWDSAAKVAYCCDDCALSALALGMGDGEALALLDVAGEDEPLSMDEALDLLFPLTADHR